MFASRVTAVSCCVAPTTIGVVGVESVTLATGTGFTVIELVPLFPSLVAVIVTGPPADAPVTRPLASTLATAGVAEVQVIVRPVNGFPPASVRVATSCCVAPTTIVADVGLTSTVLTGGGGTGLTVITGVAALGAASLVAVIVAVPGPAAVTVIVAPLDELTELAALTVNTAVLLETQLTVRPLSVASPASFGIAVSTCVSPTIIGVAGEESVTLTTGGGGAAVTVMELVPVFPSLVAVMVIGPPTLAAVRRPFASTLAIVGLVDVHVIVRPVSRFPPTSRSVAVSC